jgi:hypothetical protein
VLAYGDEACDEMLTVRNKKLVMDTSRVDMHVYKNPKAIFLHHAGKKYESLVTIYDIERAPHAYIYWSANYFAYWLGLPPRYITDHVMYYRFGALPAERRRRGEITERGRHEHLQGRHWPDTVLQPHVDDRDAELHHAPRQA